MESLQILPNLRGQRFGYVLQRNRLPSLLILCNTPTPKTPLSSPNLWFSHAYKKYLKEKKRNTLLLPWKLKVFLLLCQKMALQVIQPGKLEKICFSLSPFQSPSVQKTCFPSFLFSKLTSFGPSHPQLAGILESECTIPPVLPTCLCTAKQHKNVANC